MLPITTVIITKNEARNIEDCIRSAKLISEEIIVVDCGSQDDTTSFAKKAGAKVIEIEWQCYGHSRNTGAAAAKYDWILSLDADERISSQLAEAINTIDFEKDDCIYKIRRRNHFAGKQFRYGTLGFEKVARLYPRNKAEWDLVPVHEKLQTELPFKKIKESILHFGISGKEVLARKKQHYAALSAEKYLQQNKKATLTKRFLSPGFNGIKSYIFQLGFLDGEKGWQIAKTITYYTWLKYKYLNELQNKSSKKEEPLPSPTYSAASSFSLKR